MGKILILHDTFLYRGGGERLIIMMAKTLQADIASGFFSPGSYNLEEQGFTWKTFSLMPKIFLHEFTWMPKKLAFVCKNGLRHFGLKWAFNHNARELRRNYDTIILSGDCLSAVRHFKKQKMLYYCHTIPRYLFDQKEAYEKKIPSPILPIYKLLTRYFRKAYQEDLEAVKIILTNSKNTQARIKKFTGKDAEILYPPVDTDFFSPEKNGGQTIDKKKYFLSFARLSSIKRVDQIVLAFQKMPEECLIITYGQNDPERHTIAELARGFANIEMRCSPSDEELRELIRGAQATIYVPEDEDFGMIPIESMACGTPVIGVNEGGLRETIIDGETGILITSEQLEKNICDALQKFSDMHFYPNNCINRAYMFSLHTFQKRLKEYIQ